MYFQLITHLLEQLVIFDSREFTRNEVFLEEFFMHKIDAILYNKFLNHQIRPPQSDTCFYSIDFSDVYSQHKLVNCPLFFWSNS